MVFDANLEAREEQREDGGLVTPAQLGRTGWLFLSGRRAARRRRLRRQTGRLGRISRWRPLSRVPVPGRSCLGRILGRWRRSGCPLGCCRRRISSGRAPLGGICIAVLRLAILLRVRPGPLMSASLKGVAEERPGALAHLLHASAQLGGPLRYTLHTLVQGRLAGRHRLAQQELHVRLQTVVPSATLPSLSLLLRAATRNSTHAFRTRHGIAVSPGRIYANLRNVRNGTNDRIGGVDME